MLSRVNNNNGGGVGGGGGGGGVSWVEDKEDDDSASWNRTNNNSGGGNEEEMGGLSGFKTMLEVEDGWYVHGHNQQDLTFSPPNLGDPTAEALLLNPVDSSSSCSPSSSVFNNLDGGHSQVQYFMQPNNHLSAFVNAVSNNPLEHAFDLGEIGFLDNTTQHQPTSQINRPHPQPQPHPSMLSAFPDLTSGNTQIINNSTIGNSLCSDSLFGTVNRLVQFPDTGFSGFRGFDENGVNSAFLNRSKLLRPLETYPSTGAQPTLFQKRAALRKNLGDNNVGVSELEGLGQQNSKILSGIVDGSDKGKREVNEENVAERKRMVNVVDEMEDIVSIDGSGMNYDSDEFNENSKLNDEIGKNGGSSSIANSTVTVGGGDQKGKKKGLPAKNLMAERRRRKKLNDRLYMLRSVVPKISKVRISFSSCFLVNFLVSFRVMLLNCSNHSINHVASFCLLAAFFINMVSE